MRLVSLSALLAFSASSAIAEDAEELPFGEGSTIYWTLAYDGGSDRLFERALVAGDDYMLFQTIGENVSGDVTDYFVLYSGVDYRTCDQPQATAEERAAFAELWPLEPRKTARVTSYDDNPFTIRVDEAKSFYLMGQSHPAHQLTIDYESEEQTDEQMIVLDQLPITVSFKWEETSLDTVTLVTKPRPVAVPDLSQDTIGECAALLNEKTD